jgi:hypothetical protein
MHRALRPTQLRDAHAQSILASPQSVSERTQLDSSFRMQRMAYLMRLRALTIVIRTERDRFFHISSLTSSAGGPRPSSEHHVGGQDESGNTQGVRHVHARRELGARAPGRRARVRRRSLLLDRGCTATYGRLHQPTHPLQHRHTRRKPGPQSHGSSSPPRRLSTPRRTPRPPSRRLELPPPQMRTVPFTY